MGMVRRVAASRVALEFSSWLLSVRIQYCDSKVRTEREFNRSFLIQNIPWDVSLRDLFHQSRTFGLIKDLCITDRSSSEQSERQRRHPRLALLEFRDKWSATK